MTNSENKKYLDTLERTGDFNWIPPELGHIAIQIVYAWVTLSSLQIYGIERMGTKYERNRVKCSYLIWNEPYQVILIANGLYI